MNRTVARVVTLTSDFGLKDPYVGEMKGVILGIAPNTVIVDVTHGVEKFNVRMGAFMLASATPYFPTGTIHIAVVDPSVGTSRRPIVVRTEHNFFIGPDNGLLTLAAEAEDIKSIYEITTRRLMLFHVSNTFHGRDVFAPIAAHLANGVPLEEVGRPVTEIVKPDFAKVTHTKEAVTGEVLHIDDFGNIITNIRHRDLTELREATVEAEFSDHKLQLKMSKAYAEAKPNEPLALIGSHNYLEIALNKGDAAAKYHTKPGDKVTLTSP
jgi:S-adenosyl-L-methionine hydrolase (adenosine-forming)